MNASRGFAAVLPLFLLLSATRAHAEDPKFAEAKTYFNAGAEAFDAGQFLAAVQAFEQAYRLVPKPAIVFSIAQSHRRQFYIERKPEQARRAIAYYRRYLEQVPNGGRRSDAAQSLAELDAFAGHADEAAVTSAVAPPLPFDVRTRVMVSAPHTEHARISLDGGEPVDSPLIEEVKPGKHSVQITAEGYLSEQRALTAVEGALVAVEAPLREKPGRLLVTGPAGAELSVDGRFAGSLPLSTPLSVAPGRRFIAVTANGHVSFARDLDVKREQAKSLDVAMPISTQRKVAYGVWVTAGAGIVTGGVLSALAFNAQAEAHDIEDQRGRQNVSEPQALSHDAAIGRRDDFRQAAVISFAASAALGAAGLLLFTWDQPAAAAPPVSEEEPAGQPPRTPGHPQLELSLHPLVGPSTYGVGVSGAL